jgi:hypothetical protein
MFESSEKRKKAMGKARAENPFEKDLKDLPFGGNHSVTGGQSP